jgi:hypothetical protein
VDVLIFGESRLFKIIEGFGTCWVLGNQMDVLVFPASINDLMSFASL